MALLAVDDSAMVRRIIAEAGKVLGFETMEAENGEQALNILDEKGENISLVLLDWNMPGISGLEVLKRIKAKQKLARIPVMMVTAESERTNVIKAVQEGAINYLSKPFAQEDLIAKILQSLGQGKQRPMRKQKE